MRDLMDLLRADTDAQERLASYGLDPVRVEEWMRERSPTHSDPTAAAALYNVAKWEKRKARK